jgi:hypothetical protein
MDLTEPRRTDDAPAKDELAAAARGGDSDGDASGGPRVGAGTTWQPATPLFAAAANWGATREPDAPTWDELAAAATWSAPMPPAAPAAVAAGVSASAAFASGVRLLHSTSPTFSFVAAAAAAAEAIPVFTSTPLPAARAASTPYAFGLSSRAFSLSARPAPAFSWSFAPLDGASAGACHAFGAPPSLHECASSGSCRSTAAPRASAVDPFLLFTCLARARVLPPSAALRLGSLCRALRAEEQLWDALAPLHVGRRRRTALHAAAKSGDAARAAWLLARGAATEAADRVRAAAPSSAAG